MKELQQRQLLAAQWLSQNHSAQQQAAAAGGAAGWSQNKKQREVYVGNLAVGVVNQDVIRELFDTVMSQILPAATAAGAPVINVVMDPSQKFGFVELRSEELATAAINLDKMELCGRPMNVGGDECGSVHAHAHSTHAPPRLFHSAHRRRRLHSTVVSAFSSPANCPAGEISMKTPTRCI